MELVRMFLLRMHAWGACTDPYELKAGNHPLLGNNPDINIEKEFGKESGINELVETTKTRCTKYIDLP